jgi:hypothetical protein
VRGVCYPDPQVLQDAFERACKKWGIKAQADAGEIFAACVRSWGPHADVPEPLKKVGEHHERVIHQRRRLVPGGDVPRLAAGFHAVCTAERSGFYKPRYGAFEYTLDQLEGASTRTRRRTTTSRSRASTRSTPCSDLTRPASRRQAFGFPAVADHAPRPDART